MQETQETQVRSLGQEDPQEKKMATTPVFLPGIPWTEEACGLQLMGMQRVGHDFETKKQNAQFLFVSFLMIFLI